MSSASTWTRGGLPTPGGRARPANGRARLRGSPASHLGVSATGMQPRRLPAGRRSSPSSANCAPAAIIGRRAPNRPAGARRSVERLLKSAATADEASESFYGLLGARDARHADQARRRSVHRASIRRSTSCRMSSARSKLASIGEPALAEEMLRHQAKIGSPAEHHALIQLAKRLDLPAAQLWLAE